MARPHVVRVRQAEEALEAVPAWQVLESVAEVPLAEQGGGESLLAEELGERRLAGWAA
jgi:hypothetical protein